MNNKLAEPGNVVWTEGMVMKSRFERLRKREESWRKPWCLIMFLFLWAFLIAGIWLIAEKTNERVDYFVEPYGEVIAKIAEGVFMQMLFCVALGITIGMYLGSVLRASTRALLFELYDEVQELKKNGAKQDGGFNA